MNNPNTILNFLEQPENLPLALEVARQVQNLRPHMQRAFWDEFLLALQTQLSQSLNKDRWEISKQGGFESPYTNIKIQAKPIPTSFSGSYLVVSLMQEPPPDYRLRYGLLWARKDRPAPDSDTFRNLLTHSQIFGFSNLNQDPWWPAYQEMNICLRSDEFILAFGTQRKEFIERQVEKIWKYFSALEQTLHELNQELFQGK